MPRYEVHIPGAEPGGLTVTFRVDAPNWMQALKTGFMKPGEAGLVVHNVLVDVADDGSLHVTEGGSGRVFRIKELTEAEAEGAKVKPPVPLPDTSNAPTQVVSAVALQPKAPAPAPVPVSAFEPTRLAPRAAPVADRPVSRSAPRPTPLSTPALVLPVIHELTEPTQPVRGA